MASGFVVHIVMFLVWFLFKDLDITGRCCLHSSFTNTEVRSGRQNLKQALMVDRSEAKPVPVEQSYHHPHVSFES